MACPGYVVGHVASRVALPLLSHSRYFYLCVSSSLLAAESVWRGHPLPEGSSSRSWLSTWQRHWRREERGSQFVEGRGCQAKEFVVLSRGFLSRGTRGRPVLRLHLACGPMEGSTVCSGRMEKETERLAWHLGFAFWQRQVADAPSII